MRPGLLALPPLVVALGLALGGVQQAAAQPGAVKQAAPGTPVTGPAVSVTPAKPPTTGPDGATPAGKPPKSDATPVDLPPPSPPVRLPLPATPQPGEFWRPPLPAGGLAPAAPNQPTATPVQLAPPPALAAEDAEHEPGQLLVLWPSVSDAQRALVVLQQQYRLAPRQRHILENLGVVVALLVLPSEAEARALRDRLRAEQPGWIVDLNARAAPLQSAVPRLYANRMLGVAPARSGAVAASMLRVGVVDTQVSPLLLQPGALNGSVIRSRTVLDPAERPADAAHGDALLQLIAGADRGNNFAGAAPLVELFWVTALRDLNGKASTNSLLVAQALDWLVGQRVALINLSVGGAGDAILQAVVGRVLAANIAIVAAAGNNPAPGASPTYPAAYPGVWAATAVDVAGRLYAGATRATYAMLAAPGVELWVPVGDAGAYVSGTSYAAALTTATLAWEPAVFWKLGAGQRAAQVCAGARKLEDSAYVGCGLVQKAAAAASP